MKNPVGRTMDQLRKFHVDDLLSKRVNYVMDGKAFVHVCPMCDKENLPECIPDGLCGWCGWSAMR